MPSDSGEYFEIGELGDTHPVGDQNCPECWPGYPVPCERCEGGLVHAVFGDENIDSYWLYTKCDRCGQPE